LYAFSRVSKQGRYLIYAIIGGFIIGSALSFVAINGIPLVLFFVQSNADVARGFIWELFTSIIIVPWSGLGLIDVFFNALAVYFVDPLLSSVYSERQYYLTFLLTGFFGNLLSFVFYSSQIVSFGASGGIFGLIAGAVSYDYAFNKRVNMNLLGWFLFVFVFSTFSARNIDVFAHLGGSLLGIGIGYYLGSTNRKKYLRGAYYGWSSYP
jgi:rhomboid protease GluP